MKLILLLALAISAYAQTPPGMVAGGIPAEVKAKDATIKVLQAESAEKSATIASLKTALAVYQTPQYSALSVAQEHEREAIAAHQAAVAEACKAGVDRTIVTCPPEAPKEPAK